MRGWLVIALGLVAAPALADPLTITKSVVFVADQVGTAAAPRSLPGAVADYRTLASNPVGNLTKPVRNVVIVEDLPTTVVFSVADLKAGKGPVEFADGSLLGTGLLPSGLTYSYSATLPATDGLEFWDGASWTYQPTADANGCDSRVRAIRVTLNGTFTAATLFQLRYRVRIK